MTLIDRNPRSARAQFERGILVVLGVLVLLAVLFTARLAFAQDVAPAVVPPGAPWWAQLVMGAFTLMGMVITGVLLPAWKKKLDAEHAAALAKGEKDTFVTWALKAEHLAELTVAEVDATMKPEIAKALADGKITPEEWAGLRTKGLEVFKNLAGPAFGSIVGALGGGDPTTLVHGLIEKAVDKAARPQTP